MDIKATVIVPAASVEAARALIGDTFFRTGLSSDGNSPATHHVSSGFFLESELETILNSEIEKTVTYGEDGNADIEAAGLKCVVSPAAGEGI